MKSIFCAGVFLFVSTFTSTILAQSAGDVGLLSAPRNFDDCVIKAMKDTQNNVTADAILHSCRNQFPHDLRKKKTKPTPALSSADPSNVPLGKSRSYGAVGGSVVESVGGDHNTGFAGNMKFGYHFKPRFALELNILLLNGINTSDAFDKGGVASMNGKVYLQNNPGTSKIHPYALAGVGWGELIGVHRVIEQHGLMVHIGGGMDFDVTDTISLYVEASYYRGAGTINELQLIPVTMGIQFML
ncbi:MAG: hypothetical protein CMH81_06105 [Nitrospiraceae bacterium]|nr:hypothetical protein [Nitrospiraceae bacterium]|tara:strand:+ start:427 stop:1155 length:729 start_codon:yes stop_codon:yes gene_type:complete